MMGLPTELMPNNVNIGYYQRMPPNERYYRGQLEPSDSEVVNRGKRSYSGRLDTPGGQATTLTALRQSNQQLPPHGGLNQQLLLPPHPSNAAVAAAAASAGGQLTGISNKRTKKRLRKNLQNASPLTKTASSGILEQIATNRKTGATETIYDAEEDAEDYPDSQAVADMAVACEKQRMAAHAERDNSSN